MKPKILPAMEDRNGSSPQNLLEKLHLPPSPISDARQPVSHKAAKNDHCARG